ncbi:MAG: DUF1934 domain-containing protein [Oscillospiraceae bacterium]
MEKKQMLISIVGTQKRGNETDKIELTTTGDFYKKNEKYYLKYNESIATGFEGSTTILKFDNNDSVLMMRKGTVKSHIIIEKGKRNLCLYDTGYGEISIGIYGNKINYGLSDKGGFVNFSYTMDINTDFDCENEIQINISPC